MPAAPSEKSPKNQNGSAGVTEPTESADRTCFVISPIGSAGSPTRLRADKVLRHVIKPAAEACGYVAVRGDEIAEPGMITRQVVDLILHAPMVIADLTDHNANVYYELAIRHSIKKPIVKLIQHDQKPLFDINQSRTIPLDHTDLDSAAQCRADLIAQMRAAAKGDHDPDNPITEAIALSELRQSGDPVQSQLADLVEAVQTLSRGIAHNKSIETRVEGRMRPAAPDDWALNFIQSRLSSSGRQHWESFLENHPEVTDVLNGLEELGSLPLKNLLVAVEKVRPDAELLGRIHALKKFAETS